MEPARVLKSHNEPRNIAELYIDSRQSYLTNPADIKINISHIFGSRKFTKIKLKECCIPNLEYPVGSHNNLLVFQENGVAVDINITLSEGAYDGNSMATELQTQLNGAGANTYVVTFDSLSKRLSVSLSVGTSFNFTTGTALDVLGFTATGFVASYIGDNPVRLDGDDYYFLEVSGHSFVNYSSLGKHDVLAKIHVDVPYGNVMYYQDNGEDYLTMRSANFDYVDVRLVSPTGRSVVLPSNCHASYTLMFY